MKPRIAIPEPHSSPEYTAKRLQNYTEAVEMGGGIPVVVELRLSPTEMAQRIRSCDAVLLPGSPADIDPAKFDEPRHPKCADADPLRDTADELLLQDAFNMRKPILGICYGVQSLNVWRSGKLLQDIESPVAHEVLGAARAHTVRVLPQTRLWSIVESAAGAAGDVWVNSSHHQSISKPGDGLRISAVSSGDGIIEAVEGVSPSHWVLGVQWHPERTWREDAFSVALFRALTEEASRWHAEIAERGGDFESAYRI